MADLPSRVVQRDVPRGPRGAISTMPFQGANLRPWPAATGEAFVQTITGTRDTLMAYNLAFPAGAPDPTIPAAGPIADLTPCISRGQNGARWESRSIAANGAFLSYTFFPAVLRMGSGIYTIMYIVIYSSHRISNRLLDYSYNNTGMADEFVRVRTVPSTYGTSETINVYSHFIGDQNAQLSTVAALTNTSPVADSFLYVAPWVTPEFYAEHMSVMGPNAFNVSGASLGLAIAAAVLGAPPILYTGQLANFGNNRLPRGPKFAAAVAENNRFMSQVNGPTDVFYRTRNFDIVEDVQYIGHKISLPINTGIPMVIPFKTQLSGSLMLWINNQKLVDPGLKFLLEQAMGVRTGADIEDGIDFTRHLSPLYMCVTLMDCCIGAAAQYYAWYLSTPQARQRGTLIRQAPDTVPIMQRAQNERMMVQEAKRRKYAVESRDDRRLKKAEPQRYATKKIAQRQEKGAALIQAYKKRVGEKVTAREQKLASLTPAQILAKRPPNPFKKALAEYVHPEGGTRTKAKRQQSRTIVERTAPKIAPAGVDRPVATITPTQGGAGGGASAQGADVALGTNAAGEFGTAANRLLDQHWNGGRQRQINRSAPVFAGGLLGDALDLLI